MADITLESFGDKELRIVKIALPDGDGVLPCYIDFYRGGGQEFVKVAPAVGLYPEQASRLEWHFSIHNQWKRKDIFLIERRRLGDLTEKVSGITPAYYYKWPGKDVPAPTNDKLRINGEEVAPIPDGAEDFLEYVHQKRAIDRNVLRLAWQAVAKEAAGWLLKKKKPIDLGFVKIYALPYRSNWKEILLARFPNALWWFKGKVNKKGTFDDQLAQADFQHKLADLSLMAIHNRDNYIHWTMEAVPSQGWEEDVAELEMIRKAGGNTAYVRYHEKTLANLLPRILEVFTNYVSKTTRPFPEIRGGALDGSQKFLPYRGKSDNLPTYGRSISVSIVTPDGPPKLGNGSQFQPVSPAYIKGMQNLPRFLPPTHDVRQSVEQGNVDKPGNGQGGADRMHVLDGNQGEVKREPVLAESHVQSTNGVEGGAD